jgi:hypothetical protein
MKVVNDNLSNFFPGGRKSDMAGRDKNRSYMILYEGSIPVTVMSFSLGATTNRTFITLHMIHTRYNYRRRGHGAVAFALLKEVRMKESGDALVEMMTRLPLSYRWADWGENCSTVP